MVGLAMCTDRRSREADALAKSDAPLEKRAAEKDRKVDISVRRNQLESFPFG